MPEGLGAGLELSCIIRLPRLQDRAYFRDILSRYELLAEPQAVGREANSQVIRGPR